MSAYEELVRGAALARRRRQFERTGALKSYDPEVEPAWNELDDASTILAFALRTLETVTPDMVRASNKAAHAAYVGPTFSTQDIDGIAVLGSEALARYLAMLHASPITPPKDAP